MSRVIGVIFIFLVTSTAYGKKYHRYSDIIDSLQIAKSCKVALKQHYNKGKNLRSELVSNELVSLADWNNLLPFQRPPINGLDFYHYTNFDMSQNLFASVKNRDEAEFLIRESGEYEKLFDHLKQRSLDRCCGGGFEAGLYIAEDPLSARAFGSMLFTMSLSPDAKVLVMTYGGALGSRLPWSKIVEEINLKYPKVHRKCQFAGIEALILEDSGVDLIQYMDVSPWFILLNSRSIIKSNFYLDRDGF